MKHLVTLTLAGFASFFGVASAQHDHSAHGTEQPAAEKPMSKRVGDPWPLDTCAVAGGKLGSMGDPVIYVHESREVRFCCAGCIASFEADPAKYIEKADKEIVAQQTPRYPLEHCIVHPDVSIDASTATEGIVLVGNRLFVTCGAACAETVSSKPEQYFATLDAAVVEAQKGDYPLTTCVISGLALDSMGGPVDRVIANQLIRLCCAGCDPRLEKNPAAALSKVTEARKATAEAAGK